MNKVEYFQGRRSCSTREHGTGDPRPDLNEIDDPFSVWDAAAELARGGRVTSGRLTAANVGGLMWRTPHGA